MVNVIIAAITGNRIFPPPIWRLPLLAVFPAAIKQPGKGIDKYKWLSGGFRVESRGPVNWKLL